jgi:tRNA pseudouridine32 synthase/23S rRNA pseudouridine746 synthase
LSLIPILLDHPDFIVVNKPANLAVQNEIHKPGILPMLCVQLNVPQLWLVHRLDKITSGILILAKNAQTAATFGQMFEQKAIEKFYLAVSAKKTKKKQGMVKGGMKKVRDGKWMLYNSAKSLAISQFFSFSIQSGLRLFLVKPLTGKTHQIRVALKSVGSPILGDTLYKAEPSDRTYLHAYGIKFMYENAHFQFCCEPDFGEFFLTKQTTNQLLELKQPWALNWPKYTFSKADHLDQ